MYGRYCRNYHNNLGVVDLEEIETHLGYKNVGSKGFDIEIPIDHNM